MIKYPSYKQNKLGYIMVLHSYRFFICVFKAVSRTITYYRMGADGTEVRCYIVTIHDSVHQRTRYNLNSKGKNPTTSTVGKDRYRDVIYWDYLLCNSVMAAYMKLIEFLRFLVTTYSKSCVVDGVNDG